MIIEAPYTVGDVVSIKITSGEEMVARLDSEDGSACTVSKPLMLMATENGVGFAPFMFTVNPSGKMKIKNTGIICITKTAKDAADMYTQNTSGLVAAV